MARWGKLCRVMVLGSSAMVHVHFHGFPFALHVACTGCRGGRGVATPRLPFAFGYFRSAGSERGIHRASNIRSEWTPVGVCVGGVVGGCVLFTQFIVNDVLLFIGPTISFRFQESS